MKQARAAFLEGQADLDPDKLVFVDETGTNIGMARTHAWALEGERAYDHVPSRPPNVTTIGAIRRRGVIGAMTLDGAADGEAVLVYVREMLVPALEKGDIVIIDNASIHKVAGVEEAIEAAGARVLFLPPYSPEFNAIEEAWSKFKSILKSLGARTREALDVAIAFALSQITPSDCRGWIRHAGYGTAST